MSLYMHMCIYVQCAQVHPNISPFGSGVKSFGIPHDPLYIEKKQDRVVLGMLS